MAAGPTAVSSENVGLQMTQALGLGNAVKAKTNNNLSGCPRLLLEARG